MIQFYTGITIKKISFLIRSSIVLVLCLGFGKSYSQTTVTLGGEGTVTCPATSTATYTTPPTGVTFSNLTRGSGVTCSSATDGISGSGFNTANAAASYTANKYYTVTITADATHTFTLNSITWLTAISSGTANFTIQYINNGGTLTTFGTAAQTGTTTNTFSGSVNVAAGTSIIIYAIPANSGAAGTTIRFKNGSTFNITAASTASIALTSSPQNFGPFCNGVVNAVSLNYTTSGTVTAPFLQLSNSSGSFASGTTNIGNTITGTGPYNIAGSIPVGTAAGTYRIRVVSTDATPVISADNGSNIIINASAIISADPSNASVLSGSTPTFSVTATGASGYQWQLNTGSGFADISGATSATYTTPPTTTAMSGYLYQVIVKNTLCGNITSASATLSVYTGSYIWTNPITGVSPDPSAANPFTTGDLKDPGLTVSGITRVGASANSGQNRYNATNWPTASSIDLAKYFQFTLTPNAGYHINFVNLVYTGQRSSTGPQSVELRSSLDGYTSSIGTATITGTTINLSLPSLQNITTAITFRFYAWKATSTTGTYSIDDFTFNGTVDPDCTPTKLIFSNTIATAHQDVIIPTFKVSIACASNTVITSCNNGTITLTATGCGLKGTLTKPVVNGVATFDDIYFSRSTQTAISFTGTYSGTCGSYTPAVSNNFDVDFTGAGSPIVTTIKNENFDGSTPTWGYVIGTPPIYTNVSPEGGSDVTGIKNLGTNVMSKSYSQDNASTNSVTHMKVQGSTNTVTFSNVTGLGSYNSVKFSFQIGCLPVGSVGTGAGADNGEYMYIETSLDGGATWKKTLTNNGYSDHSFALSPASPVSLAYDADAVYSNGNSLWYQSAFEITLPTGTTQFMFRMTANDNRSNENWVVDNLLLQGTTYGTGTQKPLPVASAYDISACPGSSNTISLSVTNGVGTLTYLWTPNTNISNTTINNPVVNPMATTTYTGTVTDADGCKASANVIVTVPTGAAGSWTGAASKDYFNCLNWANGVVPTATTDVIIASTTNAVELDATSPYAATFSSTGSANNLTLGNNIITFVGGSEKLNIAGNLSLNTAGNINMTTGGTINISGNWTNGGGSLTPGIGTVNYNGSAQNIGLQTYHYLTFSGSGIKTAPASTLTVQGDLVRSGTATFNANGGTVLLNGTDQAFAGLPYNNLILTGGTKTTSQSSTIVDSIKLNDGTALSISNGDSITLQSNATKTAHIGQIGTGTIDYNSTGKFVVERYIPQRKAWRFLAVPVISSQTIKQAWQEGAANSASNPKPGYGTQITDDKIATWAANGFDAYSLNGPSMKTYNPATDDYTGVSSTAPATFNTLLGGYMTFIRGNRTSTTYTSPVTNTTLRTTGKLYTGNQPNINVISGQITPVNNPYASTIALSKLSQSSSIFYYVWDPNRGGGYGYGAFYSLSWNGTDYDVIPLGAGGSYGLKTNFIESGQAFFVSTLGSTTAVPLTENAKTFSVAEPSPFRVRNVDSKLWLNLFKMNNGENILADGVLNYFSDAYSNNNNTYDALKPFNFGENLSIVNNNRLLVVRRSPLFTPKDTIFLNLTGISAQEYGMEFTPENLGHAGLNAYLEDRYLHTKDIISLNGTTRINFIVNADQSSFAQDRFDIVFGPAAGPLPVIFTNVKAYLQNAGANVEWNVQNESGIKNYIVEKSIDGIVFSSLGTVLSKNQAAANYNLFDAQPVTGSNYYRVKSVGTDGEIKYSIIVKVLVERIKAEITVYPNPIKGSTVQLHFINQPSGKYHARLLNTLGQTIVSKEIVHTQGTAIEVIQLPANIAHGLYQLEVTQPDAAGASTISHIKLNILY